MLTIGNGLAVFWLSMAILVQLLYGVVVPAWEIAGLCALFTGTLLSIVRDELRARRARHRRPQ